MVQPTAVSDARLCSTHPEQPLSGSHLAFLSAVVHAAVCDAPAVGSDSIIPAPIPVPFPALYRSPFSAAAATAAATNRSMLASAPRAILASLPPRQAGAEHAAQLVAHESHAALA